MRIAATASGTRDEAVGSRILRGTIGGAAAGAVFMFVTMWFADSVGDPSTGPLMMISTIVKGEAAMANGTADPTLGWIIHGAISVMFGVAFAFVAPLFRTNGTVALAGIVYGALLYVLNFLVIAAGRSSHIRDGQPTFRAGDPHRVRRSAWVGFLRIRSAGVRACDCAK